MKKAFVYLMVFAMLLTLAACAEAKPDTKPTQATQAVPTTAATEESAAATTQASEATTEPATQATTEPVTKPVTEPVQAEKVTVYLLTRTDVFDSGYTAYSYDENHNIDSYQVYSLENQLMYTAYFEEKDGNGMAGQQRTLWEGETDSQIQTLSVSEDGKLQEVLYDGGNFSGLQYAYDTNGNVTEKREYYDGLLQSAVYYEYQGQVLSNAYCEDPQGNRIFDCRVEDGQIVEKVHYDTDYSYSCLYEYDENNNLIKTTVVMDGETIPGETFTYEAVEVEAVRAKYLLEQQKYLLSGAY